MEFLNGTSLEDVTDQNVSIMLAGGSSPQGEMIEICQTFLRDGRLWVDLIPQLDRKYVMPIPEDAVVSRNEQDLGFGRYGIFIRRESPAGQYVETLIDAKNRASG